MITQLWLADTRDWEEECTGYCPEEWIQQLSEHERLRLERIGVPSSVGREYLFARMLVRRGLQHNFSEVSDWTLAATGATEILSPKTPELGSDVHINISHSRGLVMCVISSHGFCGCDIENLPRGGNIRKIAQRYFTPAENRYLNELFPQAWENAFYTMWTVKEAYLKARRTGIAGGLTRVEVVPRGRRWQVDLPQNPDKQSLEYGFYRLRWGSAFGALVFRHLKTQPLVPTVFQMRPDTEFPLSSLTTHTLDICSLPMFQPLRVHQAEGFNENPALGQEVP